MLRDRLHGERCDRQVPVTYDGTMAGSLIGPARICAAAGIAVVVAIIASTASCSSDPDVAPANDAEAEASDGGPDTRLDLDVYLPPDLGPAACKAACPASGGTCNGGTCVLACPGLAACATGVTCPPGIPCRIICTGAKSCGIADCGTASTCAVECNGASSCGKVRSNASQTEIACKGPLSCPDTSCNGDVCSVNCGGGASCKAKDINCCAKTCTVDSVPGICLL